MSYFHMLQILNYLRCLQDGALILTNYIIMTNKGTLFESLYRHGIRFEIDRAKGLYGFSDCLQYASAAPVPKVTFTFKNLH